MLYINSDFIFNEQTRKLSHGDRVYTLTNKESLLLQTLWKLGREGKVVSREQIRAHVWPGRGRGVTEANLLQLICKLRRTLGYCGLSGIIQTVHQQGYTLILPPEPTLQ